MDSIASVEQLTARISRSRCKNGKNSHDADFQSRMIERYFSHFLSTSSTAAQAAFRLGAVDRLSWRLSACQSLWCSVPSFDPLFRSPIHALISGKRIGGSALRLDRSAWRA